VNVPRWFCQLRLPPIRTDGAQVVADHLANCAQAAAALVVDGNADLEIAKLLAAGWTWTEGMSTEYVAGKRIRYLTPPGGSLTITSEREQRS
jgi:hypothetical protein